MRQQLLIWGILVAIVLAASWSLLSPSLFRVHDYTQAARIVEMARGLQDGQLPVRWSQNFGFGYGMPLFTFYAPLPYYVGALVYLLGLDLLLAVKVLFILPTVLTAIGTYKMGKALTDTSGGLVAAAAYTLAPYRAVNLFARGAISESWGMMALPWIVYGIVLILQKKPYAHLVLTGSLVVLFLSHNISTLIFLPLLLVLAVCLWVWFRFQPKKDHLTAAGFVGRVGFAGLNAFFLSAFFLLPAFSQKDLTKVEASVTGDYFHYANHFLFLRQFFQNTWGYGGSNWGPIDEISFFLGYGQWLGIGLALVLASITLIKLWRPRQKNNPISLLRSMVGSPVFLASASALFTGLAIFMTLGHSQWLWDQLPVLAFVQFPWRFLGIATLGISLLSGLAVSFLTGSRLQIPVTSLLLVALLANFWYFRPERYLTDASEYYYADAARIRQEMSAVLPDYLPKDLPANLSVPPALALAPTEKTTTVLTDTSTTKVISTNFDKEELLVLAVADFPSWQVELDGNPIAKAATESGTIAVNVPGGPHRVTVALGKTSVEAFSDGLFLVGIGLLVATEIKKRRYDQ